MPPGLREIVGYLQPEPSFRTAAERLVEADCHLRRDTTFAVHQVVQGLAGCPQDSRRFGYRQSERLNAVVTNERPGWGGFFIGIAVAPALMVIDQVNIGDFAFRKAESDRQESGTDGPE